jgi:hypothetical protein
MDECASVRVGWRVIKDLSLGKEDKVLLARMGTQEKWQDMSFISAFQAKLARIPQRVRRVWDIQGDMVNAIQRASDGQLRRIRDKLVRRRVRLQNDLMLRWESARRAILFDEFIDEMGLQNILPEMSDIVMNASEVRYRKSVGERVVLWGLLHGCETEGDPSEGGRHVGVG